MDEAGRARVDRWEGGRTGRGRKRYRGTGDGKREGGERSQRAAGARDGGAEEETERKRETRKRAREQQGREQGRMDGWMDGWMDGREERGEREGEVTRRGEGGALE